MRFRNDLRTDTYRGTGIALGSRVMEPNSHRRPVPKVPEPIEYDPFEMDWPWPGMLPAEPEAAAPEAPVEPDRADLTLRALRSDQD